MSLRKITWSGNKTTKIAEFLYISSFCIRGRLVKASLLVCCFQVLPLKKNIFRAIFNRFFCGLKTRHICACSLMSRIYSDGWPKIACTSILKLPFCNLIGSQWCVLFSKPQYFFCSKSHSCFKLHNFCSKSHHWFAYKMRWNWAFPIPLFLTIINKPATGRINRILLLTDFWNFMWL